MMSADGFYERLGTSTKPYRGGEAAAIQDPGYPPGSKLGDVANAVNQLGCSRWASRGEAFYGVGETHAALEAGLYRCESLEMIGPALVKQRIETDNLLELPDDAGASILAEFAKFWEIGDRFRERCFLHKRGFLLWGPPGSGKTSTLQLMIKRMIGEMGGLVLLLDHPRLSAACLQMARKIEPKRPVIAIMEDLDAVVSKFGENEYLALLDGEAQVDNIVFLATTNYPERLDPRFVDRPSRFDTVRLIDMPSAAARRLYLITKEPGLEPAELDAWVARSDGFSIAHLKELIIAVKCFGQPLDEVVERLEAMHERRPRSEDASRMGAGFLGSKRLGNGVGAH